MRGEILSVSKLSIWKWIFKW